MNKRDLEQRVNELFAQNHELLHAQERARARIRELEQMLANIAGLSLRWMLPWGKLLEGENLNNKT